MSDDVRRRGLLGDLGRRLELVGLDDLRLVDRLLVGIELQRDRRWERRLATGPHDVDSSFHAVRRGECAVITACRGSWGSKEAVETRTSAPDETRPGALAIAEMCSACLRAVTEPDWLGTILAALASNLAIEDRDRAELHEAARDELLGTRERWDATPTLITERGDSAADSSDHPGTRGRR